MKHKVFAIIGAFLCAIGVAVASATPASAQPPEPISESGSFIEQEVFPGFCGGLVTFPVLHTFSEEGKSLLKSRDGLPHLMFTSKRTDTYTNTLNGQTLTVTALVTGKDQSIVDNGDGTFTIMFKASGLQKSYGPDGSLLFIDAGLVKLQFLLDHGGTPSDPNDDVILDMEVLAQNGRADTFDRDFCEDLVTLIG